MTPASAGALSAAKGLALAFVLGTSALSAQAPDTDVWLAPLSRVGDSLVVGTPKNVTHRPGYDNQPSFTPDSKAILYTAVVDGQADIFRYELASGAITRLTNTAESEYSATVTPDGKWFSVVRVERDSTQRLWKFPLAGGEPRLVLANVKPVGYHVWLSDTTLALYVLGQPATLYTASTRTGESTERLRGIRRSLQRIPGTKGFSFVRATCPMPVYASRSDSSVLARIDSSPCLQVAVADSVYGMPRSTFDAPFDSTQSEFQAWYDANTLLSGRGASIIRWRELPALENECQPGGRCRSYLWRGVANLGASGLRNITRLAVSPDGKWLAFVAEPVAPDATK